MVHSLSGTYDAYIHMFFGEHYNRSWFDPWEPRWYTGFSTTSYPPATHMVQALFQHILPLKASFVLTMTIGMIVLVIGYYRFAVIWVGIPSALISGFLLVFASSISETIHVFGQLPTIFSIGIFLNAMPHVYAWMTKGKLSQLLLATLMAAATTSAHHVTTLFGATFFVGALCLLAVHETVFMKWKSAGPIWKKILLLLVPAWRGGLLGVLMISAIAITVFPYWYWSFTDPINQVSIPHGTRENFLERLDLGYVFFLLPWGLTLLFLPYAAYKTISSRLWPLGIMLFLCLLLGTGGTTPLPKILLGHAFDILTLDRFSFWGSILVLPFLGQMYFGLIFGRSGRFIEVMFGTPLKTLIVFGSLASFVLVSVFISLTSSYKALQPRSIDPDPITNFMETDEHDRWRYLTLGFGDQFAYLSAHTHAQSVDGNYHSARRLPEMTAYSVERLENAKYLGVAGLGSLQQFLIEAERYSLKYVFSNDAFYDPILYFSGWNALQRLPNNIVVWEKPNVSPLPIITPRKNIPFAHRMMWGILPISALFIGYTIIFFSFRREVAGAHLTSLLSQGHIPAESFRYVRFVRAIVIICFILLILFLSAILWSVYKRFEYNPTPEQVIESYHDQLDWRRFADAYEKLDPETRPSYDAFFFERMWQGGLINSFGKLLDLDITLENDQGLIRSWQVTTHWLTSLGEYEKTEQIDTVIRDNKWYIVPKVLQAQQTFERIQTRNSPVWNVVGRRQPRLDSDLYRDRLDRPVYGIDDVKIVKYDDRFYTIGTVANLDVDPLAVTLQSLLMDSNASEMVRSTAGLGSPHRLLPLENSGFRIAHEGVLSLEDALKHNKFDPNLFVPPELPEMPKEGRVISSSVANDAGIYRGYLLSEIQTRTSADDKLIVSGILHNTGLETLSVIKILVSGYDPDGKLIWVQPAYTETVVRTGQHVEFKAVLPNASEIELIAPLTDSQIDINNGSDNDTDLLASAREGTIPTSGRGGYGSIRLFVDPMVYDEAF